MSNFENIKHSISKFKRDSLVALCINTLNRFQRQGNKTFPFWILLQVIKWSYLYTDNNILRNWATINDLQAITNDISEIENSYLDSKFSTEKDVNRSFRILAYQQFSLQDNFYIPMAARQIILYDIIKSNTDIVEEFYNLTGISILDFLQICEFTYIYLFAQNGQSQIGYYGVLDKNFFSTSSLLFSEDDISHFLNILTVRGPEDFIDTQKLNNETFQLYETNAYAKLPFLFYGGYYRVIHKQVYVQTIKHFIYVFLKERLHNFSEDLGQRMEKYIDLGLKEMGIPYRKESTLKKDYKIKDLIADFVAGNNFIIECKAIEIHPRSGVIRSQEVLTNELKHSITKAYKQLLKTASHIDQSKSWYGIVVTYDNLFLGFGVDAWKEFLKVPITDYCKNENLNINLLPPENLFFIDLENWDYLVQIIKDQKASLQEVIDKIKPTALDTNLQTKMFSFDTALKKYFAIERFSLSYLEYATKLLQSYFPLEL